MTAAAPLTPAEMAVVDKLANHALAATGVPAASITVVRDGAIAYTQAYGSQRLAPATPANVAARYQIASISKQFTAAAILC